MAKTKGSQSGGQRPVRKPGTPSPATLAQSRKTRALIAVTLGARPGWRWRIVDGTGEPIEESRQTFRTLALALASGRRRLEKFGAP